MSCALRRSGLSSRSLRAVTSRPSKRMRPAVGSISLSTSRPRVDLPQPDSPTSASVLLASSEKVTPSTAVTIAVGRPKTERRATNWRPTSSTSSSGALMTEPARAARGWTARSEAASPRERGHARHHAVDGGELVDAPIEPWNGAEETDRVGVLRGCEQHIDRRTLDDLARIHDGDLVANLGDHSEIVGYENDRGIGGGLQVTHEVEDLRLNGDVERRRGLVGNQELRIASECESDHCPLAHAAGKPMRIVVDALLGRWDFHQPQQIDGARTRLSSRQAAVADEGLRNLLAYRVDRIERRHRFLEDHRQPIAAQVAHLAIGQAEQIGTIKANSARHLGRALGQQSHDRQRGDALAAPGFADKAQGLSAPHREIDAINRMRRPPAIVVKDDLEIFDFEEGTSGAQDELSAASAFAISLSTASRSVTPTRSRRITSAADCFPRLSPPAASPALIAAISRRGNESVAFRSYAAAVSSITLAPASMLPATEILSPARCPHQPMQPFPVCAAMRPCESITCTCRCSRPTSAAVTAATTSSALAPCSSSRKPSVPKKALTSACVAIAPMRDLTRGTSAPTAKKRLATAIPNCPVP